jgi:hypothetical protein
VIEDCLVLKEKQGHEWAIEEPIKP